jgi:hypothetical protein
MDISYLTAQCSNTRKEQNQIPKVANNSTNQPRRTCTRSISVPEIQPHLFELSQLDNTPSTATMSSTTTQTTTDSKSKPGQTDFFWSYTEEPHRTRRQAIIKAHPEVCIPQSSLFALCLSYSILTQHLTRSRNYAVLNP